MTGTLLLARGVRSPGLVVQAPGESHPEQQGAVGSTALVTRGTWRVLIPRPLATGVTADQSYFCMPRSGHGRAEPRLPRAELMLPSPG